jgi:hypothetical protein
MVDPFTRAGRKRVESIVIVRFRRPAVRDHALPNNHAEKVRAELRRPQNPESRRWALFVCWLRAEESGTGISQADKRFAKRSMAATGLF